MSVVMMEREQESWSDDRLDDLSHKVDEGFKDTREEFRSIRGEMRAGFQEVRGEMREGFQEVRGEMREGFQEVRGEMAADRRALVQVAAAIWITSLVGFLGVIATVLTRT